MALATYGVVIAGTVLLVQLDLGTMSAGEWALYLALAVVANAGLWLVFRTGLNLRFADPSLTAAQIVVSAAWGMVPLSALPAARPIILLFYLPAFSFGMLRFTRRQYLQTVAVLMGLYGAVLVWEVATGRPGFSPGRELFLFGCYGIVLTWFAFFGGFVSQLRRELGVRRRAVERAHAILQEEMAGRIRTQKENESLIAELEASLAKVRRLSGMLPICSACKKIRDDRGYWNQIELYIEQHSEAGFSHGICPDCARRLYPQLMVGDTGDPSGG
jgi:hypothetical protein